jgi:sugar/nucleoside kinase (ribokinase family)
VTRAPFHVTGVLSMDRLAQEKQEVFCAGSSGLYVSVALARLGHAVKFWSQVGPDFDWSLLEPLQPEGIVWQLRTVPGSSARLSINYDAAGHIACFRYDPGVGRELRADALEATFWSAPCVWLGAAFPDYHLDVARRSAQAGQAVYLSPQGDYDDQWPDFEPLLPHLAGLFMNSREVQALCGAPLAEAVQMLYAGRPDLMCSVTCGERGALLAWRGSLYRVNACPMPLGNATGAGDTYAAALVHWMLEGASVEDSLMAATVAAGLSMRSDAYWGVARASEVLAELGHRRAELRVEGAPLHSPQSAKWLLAEATATRQDAMPRRRQG